MKKEQLLELLKKHTDDEGNINYDLVSKGINDNINQIRDSHLEKSKAKIIEEAKAQNINDFIKGYEFENVDQFSAFVTNSKSSSNELTEKATRLEKELADLQTNNNSIQEKYNNLNKELTNIKQVKLAKDFGVQDDFIEFALFEANKSVTEEKGLEDVLKELKENKPNLFGETEPRIKKVGLTHKNDPKPVHTNVERFKELRKQRKI